MIRLTLIKSSTIKSSLPFTLLNHITTAEIYIFTQRSVIYLLGPSAASLPMINAMIHEDTLTFVDCCVIALHRVLQFTFRPAVIDLGVW